VILRDFGEYGYGAMTFAKNIAHSFRLGREGMGGDSVQVACCGLVSRLLGGSVVVELQSKSLATRVNGG
jgi:hypothetical protein